MNKNVLHTTVAIVIIILLLALADFFPFWMPMMGQLITLMLVSVGLIVWAGFVLQEQPQDEREVVLKMKSGRVAYVSGLAVLLIALIVQTMEHAIDPWIAVSLGVMVAAKLVARSYLE